jgi:ABC-2 type transport system ATP-binding protein
MLEAVNLTKSYPGKLALSGLGLKVEPGEIYCLLGGPASGKTTAIELFLGLRKPTSGAASVNGSSANSTRSAKAMVAHVPPEFAVYPKLTARENLDFLVAASSLAPLTDRQCEQLLHEFGLESAARAPGEKLTQAERQKLGLAIGVARDAHVFLLDDPTRGLEEAESAFIATVLRRLASGAIGGEPSTILAATSDPVLASGAADRVGLLSGGRVREVITLGLDTEQRCRAHLESA